MLQNLGSDYLPVLLIISLSPIVRSNECLPSLNFQKARWDDFAFYFDSHCPAEEYSSFSLFFAAALFTSLALNALLTIWCSGQTALFFSFLAMGSFGVLTSCSLCGIEATLFFSAGPVCSSFFAQACAILQTLCWSRQHQQVCHFSFSYLILALCSPLFPPSFLLPKSPAATVLFFLLFYPTTMGPWTLVSPVERLG